MWESRSRYAHPDMLEWSARGVGGYPLPLCFAPAAASGVVYSGTTETKDMSVNIAMSRSRSESRSQTSRSRLASRSVTWTCTSSNVASDQRSPGGADHKLCHNSRSLDVDYHVSFKAPQAGFQHVHDVSCHENVIACTWPLCP